MGGPRKWSGSGKSPLLDCRLLRLGCILTWREESYRALGGLLYKGTNLRSPFSWTDYLPYAPHVLIPSQWDSTYDFGGDTNIGASHGLDRPFPPPAPACPSRLVLQPSRHFMTHSALQLARLDFCCSQPGTLTGSAPNTLKILRKGDPKQKQTKIFDCYLKILK